MTELPHDWLDALRPLQATSRENFVYARDYPRITNEFYYSGLVAGAAGASISGFDAPLWITEKGLAALA